MLLNRPMDDLDLIEVRLASLGRPGLPRYVRIALTGLTRVSPQCPACGVGHLGVT